ncbi:MAG: lipopolysaccharide transport periplasmic protein LptA [Gammaproteobacteria bacterium]|nr:lipopolysaccharide transport periplasmic protein LptA [Gammaproteobacteria bacterium]
MKSSSRRVEETLNPLLRCPRAASCARSLLLLAVFASPAHALSTDAQQPVQIEADFAELDDEEHTTVYVGNVVVDQGSMHMTGDRLRVNFTENKDMKDAYLEGRPATFKQTPDHDDDVHGQAMQIEYHADRSLLNLIDKARVTQGERLFEGHRINYDTKKSIITARSARAGEADKDQRPKEGSGRVRIIIPPKKKPPETAPAASTAAPVATPAPTAPAAPAAVVVPPAGDGDKDGVPDGEDKCPASAAGAKVNAQGCRVSS